MPAHAIIMLDGVTGTGAGPALGLQGEAMATGGSPAARQYTTVPYEIVATATGGTATVQIQTSPDGSSFTTIGTLTLASGATLKSVGKLTTRYLRLNVSAISGATVNAYTRVF